jgi:hypothetical protein
MSEPNPSRLTGHDLAFVLAIVAVCIGVMEWKALDAGVDGVMFAAAMTALGVIGGLAVGRVLPR